MTCQGHGGPVPQLRAQGKQYKRSKSLHTGNHSNLAWTLRSAHDHTGLQCLGIGTSATEPTLVLSQPPPLLDVLEKVPSVSVLHHLVSRRKGKRVAESARVATRSVALT